MRAVLQRRKNEKRHDEQKLISGMINMNNIQED